MGWINLLYWRYLTFATEQWSYLISILFTLSTAEKIRGEIAHLVGLCVARFLHTVEISNAKIVLFGDEQIGKF